LVRNRSNCGDFDFAYAHKLFNLARGNKCAPGGSTCRVAGRARFTHEPFMIFVRHGIAGVSTANFTSEKADASLVQYLKSSLQLPASLVGLTRYKRTARETV
jgi:hypothetical protein